MSLSFVASSRSRLSPAAARLVVAILSAAIHGSGCAARLPTSETAYRDARVFLSHARSSRVPAERRAVYYLAAAQAAASSLDSPEARRIYDSATAEMTILLAEAEDGGMWNRPLELSGGGTTYRLEFGTAKHHAAWAPDYFTSFELAGSVPEKHFDNRNLRDGVGGRLVGIRKTDPPEPFASKAGVTAPVTAVLDFHGNDATLHLLDPTERAEITVGGQSHSLAADFTAPLAWYPAAHETWLGLMGALRVSHYLADTRLVMEQPYDPDRIPLLFVHGLISTPQMWRNILNEIERDPELRGRYQLWVFGYPTGNPVVYSAYRLRQALDEAQRRYGMKQGMVLVSHSMGGLLSRLQATTVTRGHWEEHVGAPALELFDELPEESLVHHMLTFKANPKIDRIVFICTPHRGSKMAIGSFGHFAASLIALPGTLVGEFGEALGDVYAGVTGDPHRIPNSVESLSPSNPALKVIDKRPVEAPHHTIAGDRGLGDSPNSSDGVVEYWSSNLASAESEKIVPGPHGAYALPETIDELRRILRLHLKSVDRQKAESAAHPQQAMADAGRLPAQGEPR